MNTKSLKQKSRSLQDSCARSKRSLEDSWSPKRERSKVTEINLQIRFDVIRCDSSGRMSSRSFTWRFSINDCSSS
jgi:hypothetical protein